MLVVARRLLVLLPGLLNFSGQLHADPVPVITSVQVSNAQTRVQFQLYPGAQQYSILRAAGLEQAFAPDDSGSIWGNTWIVPVERPQDFYRLRVSPMDANRFLTATALNRLAYGPTPDELERVTALGAEAYIQEQLAPELIQENLDIDALPPNDPGWQYVTATGSGSSSTLYIYLNATGGEGYVDDVTLVAGTKPGEGLNLIRNGGFEAPLGTNDWTVSANLLRSDVTTEVAHSGTGSLKLVTTLPGSTKASSIWQTISPALTSSRQYTLSFWFRPSTNKPSSITVRLSGSGIVGSTSGSLLAQLMNNEASLDMLRSWHVLRAVESRRQLLEVLLQFIDNHFVTEYTKSSQYFDQFYNGVVPGRLATQAEFKQLQRWRQALLNPICTFQDLLKISAESPGMIIYLDTVTSRGDGNPPRIANENYARELLELFTFGVDNGYDQNDIVALSQCWTGWRVELVEAANEFNPFARRLVDQHPGVNVTNLVGTWAFNYRSDRHNNNTKKIFPGKIVPNRFGAPYAGRSYELALPARAGTNGIRDGYEVIAHLADQPFTQEFISVKLCRLLVHDDFAIGYDFTDPNLSAEGRLVRQCMDAWESTSPKGQIRAVLSVIFGSDMFRGLGASMQKGKTPLEFTVSAIRALRSALPDGSSTAQTDGNIGTILARMGGMRLFDRAEPDGYPETAPPWISAGTLAERLRFVQALLIAKGQSGRSDANNCFTEPVALIKNKLPASDWNNAGAMADYFLGILYPAEGTANLELYRASAVGFLDTADNGVSASAFNSLAVGSTAYDTRLRGMVAMLLTFQRFNEQ